jgi:hypothetical protein
MEADLRTALSLGGDPVPPILAVSSLGGTGVPELWQAIRAARLRRSMS